MSERLNDQEMSCERAAELMGMQAGGELSLEMMVALDGHLDWCDACRQLMCTSDATRRALSQLAEIPFPEEALEAVWAQTVHRGAPGRRFWMRPVFRRAFATAAVMGMTFFVWRAYFSPKELHVSDAEVARLAAQTQLVFELTDSALREVERATLDGLLAERLPSAIRKMQHQWIKSLPLWTRRTGT